MNRITEKTLLLTLIALVVVFGIFINNKIGTIQDLSHQIGDLSVTVNNQSQQISGLYVQIDDLLKKQASIIDSYDIAYGLFDSDDMTYAVSIDVTPKEFQSDTTAVVTLGDLQRDMHFSGASFSAALRAPITEGGNPTVTFHEDGGNRSETLESVISFKDHYLHQIKCGFSGEKSYRGEQMHYDGYVFVASDLPGGSAVESGRIVAILNDQEIWEKAFTLAPQDENTIECDASFAVGPGDVFALYVDIRDGNGILYRYPLDSTAVSADGQSLSENFLPDQCAIYDKHGEEIIFE